MIKGFVRNSIIQKNTGVTFIGAAIYCSKKNEGITLIALVVTIMVMLILAGVTISMVIGNNGVLTQSSKAVTATNMAKVKEEVSLALASIESEYYTAWASNNTKTRAEYYIQVNLEKYLQGEVRYTATSTGEELKENEPYIVVYAKVDYEVMLELNENGSYSLKEGTTVKGGTTVEEGTTQGGTEEDNNNDNNDNNDDTQPTVTLTKTGDITNATSVTIIATVTSGFSGIEKVKWLSGEKTEEDFANDEGATLTEPYSFAVTKNGWYTVYVEGKNGLKATSKIQVINILQGIVQAVLENEYADGSHSLSIKGVTYSLEVINFYEDVTYNSSNPVGTTLGSTTTSRMLILIYHGNLTIESGQTLTPRVSKKGMLVCVKGTLTNKGTISMTARGVSATGQDVYLWKTATGSFEYVPATRSFGGCGTGN